MPDYYLAIILPIISLTELALGFFVFAKKPRATLNQIFALFSLLLAFWVFVNYLLAVSPSLFWIKMAYGLAAVLIISCILWLTKLVEDRIKKWKFWLLNFLGLALFIFSFINDIKVPTALTPAELVKSGFETKTRFFLIYASVITILLATVLAILVRGYLHSPREKRLQLNYVLIGLSQFIVGGFFFAVLLPTFGISQYSLLDSACSIFFLVFTVLAITRRKLFEIKAILTETLVFLMGFALLVIPFLLDSSFLKIVTGVIFLLFCFCGFLLIRSTLREIGHKDVLAQQVYERTRDLIAANRALEQLLQQIKDEKEKTAALVNNFSDGLILVQNDHVILVNPKARAIFNLSPEDLLKQDLLELTKNIKIYPLVRLLLVKGPKLEQEELILENKQPRQILEVTTATITEKNQEKGQIVILHDITRQKVIERMKRDFVMVAAHQLREPLTALKWNIDLLRKKDLGPLTATQEEFLTKANQSNETMMKLVNDLLSSIELEYGKSPYTFRHEDIMVLTQKAVAEMRPAAENKGLKLILELPTQAVPQVRLDGDKFKMALQNIIDNAIRYSRQGSVHISCLFLEKTKRFQFRIEDEGIGIPPEEHTKVFSRFYRSAEAIRLEAKGSGLGLHMTQNIIEAHGGKIWFDSQPGKGTTFNFSIPLMRPV